MFHPSALAATLDEALAQEPAKEFLIEAAVGVVGKMQKARTCLVELEPAMQRFSCGIDTDGERGRVKFVERHLAGDRLARAGNTVAREHGVAVAAEREDFVGAKAGVDERPFAG